TARDQRAEPSADTRRHPATDVGGDREVRVDQRGHGETVATTFHCVNTGFHIYFRPSSQLDRASPHLYLEPREKGPRPAPPGGPPPTRPRPRPRPGPRPAHPGRGRPGRRRLPPRHLRLGDRRRRARRPRP